MKGSDILKQKVEIMSMTDEILSPITKASNVLLEDGSNVQQLIDNYVEPEFTPTIETSSSMSKVGQGDNVDFSANVINGAYESCVLKGKTLVNYNAEGNDRNEYVCMPSVEGESVTVNGTVEGLVKSAILKGNTLVNLHETSFLPSVNNAWQSLNNHIITLKVSQYSYNHLMYDYSKLKPNCKYAVVVDVIENNLTRIDGGEGAVFNSFAIASNITSFSEIEYKNGEIGKKVFTFSTPSNGLDAYTSSKFLGTPYNALTENKTIKFKVALFEVDSFDNVDSLEYFEGMQSVKLPVLTTTGKNLFDMKDVGNELVDIHPGFVINSDGTWTITSSSFHYGYKYKPINFKENTQYTLSATISSKTPTIGTVMGFLYTDGTFNYITSNKNTLTSDINKTIECITFSYGASGIAETWANIQLEEGSTSTPYEPFKSNILTVNEEVELRAIGEVKDELNLTTGELTQRIDEIVLDGSEDEGWTILTSTGSGATYFRCAINNLQPSGSQTIIPPNLINDKLPLVKYYDMYTGIVTDNVAITSGSTVQAIFVWNSNIEKTESAIRNYLQQNPITVQYRLAKESVKTVDLKGQKVYSYNDTTHYTCSSAEGSLIPTLSIEEGVKYQAIIKPSTKYSIVFNRTVASDSLTVDLGGATANVVSTAVGKTIVQITALPTLSHNYVKFLGVGNAIKDVQVIEGDVADDIEYFEGMIDIENPAVTNCNMLDVYSVDYKSNTISTNEVVLRSLPNGVCDTLDLMTGEYVQRIGEREYQSGDESNSQVSTDKVNTRYQLETPITTTIDLKQHPYAYKDGYINLSSSSEKSLTPSIEYSLPINRGGQVTINTQLVQKQQKQLDELESMIIANMVNTQYKQTLSSVEYMLGGE